MMGPAAGPAFSFSGLLSVLAGVYGGATKLRSDAYGHGWLRVRRLPCRVISVGNIVLGGTGKTPMVIYLARQLQDLGIRTAVVSRGYRGRAERAGGIVSNGDRLLMGSEEAGDEPCMMARTLKGVPVLVGQDRYRTGRIALDAFAPEVIILDDGFQHLRLHRDINLVLLDTAYPIGNGRIFPRGTLREPISALSRADAVIMTRWSGDIPPTPTFASPICRKASCRLPVFHAAHRSHIHIVDSYLDARGNETPPGSAAAGAAGGVYAFSAIARNLDFVNALKKAGYRITGSRLFPDHHRYSQGEIRSIIEAARASNAGMLATTEKDVARIGEGIRWPMPLVVAGVTIFFGPQAEAFRRWVVKSLDADSNGEAT